MPGSRCTNGSGVGDQTVIRQSLELAARIMLADDHRLVRSALRRLLEAGGGMEVVAEAGDVEETVRKVEAYKPDVLVLDVDIPGGSGLEAIPRLLEISPRTAIVVLTMHSVPQFARVALRCGARGFVLKEAADTELVDAVRAALDGRGYLTPGVGAQIAAEPPPTREPPDGLTRRQLEVLRLVVNGYTNPEIAGQLGIGERTVEAHRKQIRHKVHRNSRADLVSYARVHRLVEY